MVKGSSKPGTIETGRVYTVDDQELKQSKSVDVKEKAKL